MKELSKAVQQIKTAVGSNEKMYYLKMNQDLEGFKELLKFVYNPYIRTGIADTKLYKKQHDYSSNVTLVDIIKHFTYNQNGSDADIGMAWDFINSQTDADSRWLAEMVVTKNLKIGITAKTINKVFGKNFIPEFAIMLGKPYQDYKQIVKGPFIITEKLDGHRRILVKENGVIKFHTRSGIVDDGLVDLEYEAMKLPDNCAYDGEALAIGKFNNALELRQATNSIMNRDGIRTGVTYNIFDSMPIEEFKQGRSTQPAYIRKIFTGALFNDPSILKLADITTNVKGTMKNLAISYDFQFITSVPIMGYASTEEDVISFAQHVWDRKFEGVMALQKDSYYETKRSNNLLKVKCTESHDLPIVDMIEGTNKNEGKLGALVVNYKGYRVGVGTGLTDYDRDLFWQNKDKYIGKIIELDTFGETKNKDGSLSLNCAVFKGVRNDK